MKFNPGDYVVIVKDAPMSRTGERARVLGHTHNLDGYYNVTFEDNKPYATYAEADLALAPDEA